MFHLAFRLSNDWRISVDNFEIVADKSFSRDGCGVTAYRSFYLEFTNNSIYDNGQSGVQTVRCGRIRVEGNYCYDNSFTGFYQGSGISLYQTWDYPVVSTPPADPRIYQNVIRGNHCGWNENQVNGPGGNHTDGNGIIVDDGRQQQDSVVEGEHDARLNQEPRGGTLVENNTSYQNGGRGVNIFLSTTVTP